MNVTYANQIYHCSRAIRTGSKATLYLTDGSTVEFVGVSESAWEHFQLEDGDWEIGQETPSDTDRLDALESAILALMGGINSV